MEYEIYSSRNRSSEPTIYQYDHLPQKLKNQIYLIVDGAMGFDRYSNQEGVESYYKFLWEYYEKQHGILDAFTHRVAYRDRILSTIKNESNLEKLLDVIELCFMFISMHITEQYNYMETCNATISAQDAIFQLNKRFKENSIGYQFTNDIIIKLSNELLHQEIVVPTIELINNKIFKNANEEYTKAHEHFKNGLNKECLNECLKAIESTLKIIFANKGWEYDQNHALSDLIATAYRNNLIPTYLQTQLGAIRTVLTSGVNTIRNRVGGHGQGAVATTADDETTRFTFEFDRFLYNIFD